MTSDRKQQLVLGGSQPGRFGLFLAPAQEPPQPGAKVEEVLEIRLIETHIARQRLGLGGAAGCLGRHDPRRDDASVIVGIDCDQRCIAVACSRLTRTVTKAPQPSQKMRIWLSLIQWCVAPGSLWRHTGQARSSRIRSSESSGLNVAV